MRRPKGPVRNVWHDVWYARSVKKTTVYLPDELKARVERMAATMHQTEASVIRAALETYTKVERPRPRAGLFEHGNLAGRVDDLLAGGFGED